MYVFVASCSCMRFLEKMMWSSSKPNVDLGHHQVFVILTDMSSYADALREADVSVNCWQGRWDNLATTGCFILSKSKLVKCTVISCHSPQWHENMWKNIRFLKRLVVFHQCYVPCLPNLLPKQHQQTPTTSVDARCLQLEKKCQDEEDTLVTCALVLKKKLEVAGNSTILHHPKTSINSLSVEVCRKLCYKNTAFDSQLDPNTAWNGATSFQVHSQILSFGWWKCFLLGMIRKVVLQVGLLSTMLNRYSDESYYSHCKDPVLNQRISGFRRI